MPRQRREQQDGKLLCPGCNRWLHHTRFRKKGHGSMLRFERFCKACEQTDRVEKKNQDRARAIIEGRASTRARKSGVSKDFVMVELNYKALIAPMRAMLNDDALCPNCAHPFLNERDVQLEHRLAPRDQHDWARLHARNIWFACASCNNSKSTKDYPLWLDEQESIRCSIRSRVEATSPMGFEQLQLV